MLIIALVVIIFLIILFLLMHSCSNRNLAITEISTTNVLDFEPANDTTKGITIPGTDGLYLKSNSLQQAVDFYNPESNICYFVIGLYLSDNTLLWQSDYLKPAEHINEITISQKLNKGKYRNCRIVYNCYSLDNKEPLNNGEIIIEITSI